MVADYNLELKGRLEVQGISKPPILAELGSYGFYNILFRETDSKPYIIRIKEINIVIETYR